MNNQKRKIKIVWLDAVGYNFRHTPSDISRMETIGFLEKENKEYVIIKDPLTRNILTNAKHPKEQPTFYIIPKSSIESLEDL